MAICMYSELAREERAAAHEAFIAAPGFLALRKEAESRGFRKATIGEIHASAEKAAGYVELFCWRGGLWVAA